MSAVADSDSESEFQRFVLIESRRCILSISVGILIGILIHHSSSMRKITDTTSTFTHENLECTFPISQNSGYKYIIIAFSEKKGSRATCVRCDASILTVGQRGFTKILAGLKSRIGVSRIYQFLQQILLPQRA